jgi:cobalt-zinc-cadmium efflux system membrane fusion protein
VNADIAVGSIEVPVLVPKGAVLLLQGETVVFVEIDGGFKPDLVKTGRSNKTHVEVLSGLSQGQRYVARGAFSLKAQIITSGVDPHAGHGH